MKYTKTEQEKPQIEKVEAVEEPEKNEEKEENEVSETVLVGEQVTLEDIGDSILISVLTFSLSFHF
jgi:hypothetical protein